ncbi:MAG: pyridoxal 5'-phosphate synthase glutaminase subunit PdxT [Actinobacteria bacterium]|nr:pyridoxal 5'-phosphate synthase glutaminase subunit PdxT [Actinomycetota bacterium]
MKRINVGVLALQGDFKEHIKMLEKIGASAVEIRFPEQLEEIDGLIIPGGESTTINKLMDKYGFKERLKDFYGSGKPIFGTCAGLIVLASEIPEGGIGLGFIDIKVRRNAYGRQIDSFEDIVGINLDHKPDPIGFRSIFIRAPKIIYTGENVSVLSSSGDEVLLARQRNILVCAFHPELTDDTRIHEYFIEMINKYLEEK